MGPDIASSCSSSSDVGAERGVGVEVLVPLAFVSLSNASRRAEIREESVEAD